MHDTPLHGLAGLAARESAPGPDEHDTVVSRAWAMMDAAGVGRCASCRWYRPEFSIQCDHPDASVSVYGDELILDDEHGCPQWEATQDAAS